MEATQSDGSYDLADAYSDPGSEDLVSKRGNGT